MARGLIADPAWANGSYPVGSLLSALGVALAAYTESLTKVLPLNMMRKIDSRDQNCDSSIKR